MKPMVSERTDNGHRNTYIKCAPILAKVMHRSKPVYTRFLIIFYAYYFRSELKRGNYYLLLLREVQYLCIIVIIYNPEY